MDTYKKYTQPSGRQYNLYSHKDSSKTSQHTYFIFFFKFFLLQFTKTTNSHNTILMLYWRMFFPLLYIVMYMCCANFYEAFAILSLWSFFITHIFGLKNPKKIKLQHIHKKIKMVSTKKSVVVKNGFLYRRYSLNCKFTPFTLTYLQDGMPVTLSRTNRMKPDGPLCIVPICLDEYILWTDQRSSITETDNFLCSPACLTMHFCVYL